MEWEPYLRMVLALAAVVGLIAGAAWIARRSGLAGGRLGQRGKRRLSIVESLGVDSRRRLVLIRRDDTEHLLLIGGGSDLLIEQPRTDPP